MRYTEGIVLLLRKRFCYAPYFCVFFSSSQTWWNPHYLVRNTATLGSFATCQDQNKTKNKKFYAKEQNKGTNTLSTSYLSLTLLFLRCAVYLFIRTSWSVHAKRLTGVLLNAPPSFIWSNGRYILISHSDWFALLLVAKLVFPEQLRNYWFRTNRNEERYLWATWLPDNYESFEQ